VLFRSPQNPKTPWDYFEFGKKKFNLRFIDLGSKNESVKGEL
jgi:hypothetical protein